MDKIIFIYGMFVGVTIGVVMALVASADGTGTLLLNCEADLPRSQQCILVAVPEKNHEAVNRNTDSATSTNR